MRRGACSRSGQLWRRYNAVNHAPLRQRARTSSRGTKQVIDAQSAPFHNWAGVDTPAPDARPRLLPRGTELIACQGKPVRGSPRRCARRRALGSRGAASVGKACPHRVATPSVARLAFSTTWLNDATYAGEARPNLLGVSK